MPEEQVASAVRAVIRGLRIRIDALVEAAGQACSRPSAAGRCAPPWDVQPAVLSELLLLLTVLQSEHSCAMPSRGKGTELPVPSSRLTAPHIRPFEAVNP